MSWRDQVIGVPRDPWAQGGPEQAYAAGNPFAQTPIESNAPSPVVPSEEVARRFIEPGPSRADAFRMGQLAGMEAYNAQDTPHEVFGAYDRAQAQQAKDEAILQQEQRKADRLRAIIGGEGPADIRNRITGLNPVETQRAADKLIEDWVLPADAFGWATTLPGAGWAGKAAIGLGAAALSADPAQAAGVKLPRAALKKGGEEAAGGAMGKVLRDPAFGTENWLPSAYVVNPQRVYAPGIYRDPRIIAAEAAQNVAPEHPALKQLFGVTRDDLWQIGGKGARPGNIDPSPILGTGRGSYVSSNIMTPANAQRQIDTLAEARKYPELSRGMEAWYVMDPAFQRMVELVGFDKAVEEYRRFNAMMTPFSSNATVLSEINRGTAARMMADRGEWDKFVRYGGMPVEERPRNFPAVMRDVDPHLRHVTQYPPVERWLATGSHGFADTTIKNPLYSQASGVPATGFQTRLPVPDAHLARGAGAADVRTNADFERHMTLPEYRQFGPWYREEIAKPLGLEAVPAQALQWGTMAKDTGVKTAVGAPKLELLAQSIDERAKSLGIDPKKLRDDVLLGKAHALWLIGAGLGAGSMGSLADQGTYNYREGGA